MAVLAQIFRYPIKGLTPEPLQSATLLNYPALASLRVECDLDVHRIQISQNGRRLLEAHTDRDRAALSAFFTEFLRRPENAHPAHPDRAVQFVGDAASRFPDRNTAELSLVSRATLRQVSERFAARRGAPAGAGALATECFRINLIVGGDDVAPWAEFDWQGREVQVGEVRLKITGRIGRCATTEVNPSSGVRDADVVGFLGEEFGHKYLGVLAVIERGGTLRIHDPITMR